MSGARDLVGVAFSGLVARKMRTALLLLGPMIGVAAIIFLVDLGVDGWANPFYSKRRISLRVKSFESEHLKVNDIEGNPIEIAAIIVWKVVDTAQACFHVDNYERFVAVQSESAVRNLATRYAYDAHDDDKPSLRGHTDTIADELRDEIQARLADAGVEVIEARISHLARGAAGNQVLRIGRSCGRCSHSGEYQGADSESDHWPRLAAGNTLGW